MSRIYKGAVNVKLRLDTGRDVSTANDILIRYKKPDGTEGTFQGTVEDSNYVIFVTTSISDLNVAGRWELQVYISDLSGWTDCGEITSFYVEAKLHDIDIGRGYCGFDDVQKFIKRVQFGSNSKVTLEDVKDHIEFIFHEINAHLGSAGLDIPVSSSAVVSYRMLKRLNALGASAYVEMIPSLAVEKESTLGKIYLEQYEKILFSYTQNPKLLYDAKQKQSRLMSSTEKRDEATIAFPVEKGEDFIMDHRQDFSGT